MVMAIRLLLIIVLGVLNAGMAHAQDKPNLVARLRVETPGVELRRVNTIAWLPIKVESLVGVGDSFRTTETGRATLSHFDGLVVATVLPRSELTLNTFNGDSKAFELELAATRSFQDFQTLRTLDDKSAFGVVLPTFGFKILSGTIRTRVEDNQRSAALNNAPNSQAVITWKDGTSLTLDPNTGVRVGEGEAKGELVPARSFAELDSALDGCSSQTSVGGDVQINVRAGASLDAPRIGGIDGKSAVQAMGATLKGGWYRIRFKDGFGWIAVDKLPVDKNCARLRPYADGYAEPTAP